MQGVYIYIYNSYAVFHSYIFIHIYTVYINTVYIYTLYTYYTPCLFTFCPPLHLFTSFLRQVSMGSQSCGVVGGTPGPSGSTVSARTNSTPEELMGSKSSPSSSVSDTWPLLKFLKANLEYPKLNVELAIKSTQKMGCFRLSFHLLVPCLISVMARKDCQDTVCMEAQDQISKGPF